MKIPIPQLTIEILYVPTSLVIAIVWFISLWFFYIMYGRCECGAFYHTKKEEKAFKKFILFTILSSLVIFIGGVLMK